MYMKSSLLPISQPTASIEPWRIATILSAKLRGTTTINAIENTENDSITAKNDTKDWMSYDILFDWFLRADVSL